MPTELELTEANAALDARVAELTDVAMEKRKTYLETFKARYEKKYSDINPERVLVGYDMHHTIKLYANKFSISLPTGGKVTAVNELIKSDPSITERELLVLSFIRKYENTDKANPTSFEFKVPKDDLTWLRNLPELLVAMLAEECIRYRSWLNAVLELDMGNF